MCGSNIVKGAIATLVLAAVMVPPASAKNLWTGEIGNWTIGAHSDDGTGEFSHCAAAVPYHTGTLLLFSIDAKLNWKMGLANKEWNLSKGSKYRITYQIDDGISLSGEVTALDKRLAVMPLEDSSVLFNMFRRGHILKIVAAERRYLFSLKDSAKALSFTLDCVTTWNRRADVASNNRPFGPPASVASNDEPFGRPASSNNPSTDMLRAEAAAVAANVLSSAGVAGFRILNEIPKDLSGYHAVFNAPGLVGAIVIDPDPKTTIETASIILPAADAKECKGKFASFRVPKADGAVEQVRTACVSEERASHSVYTITQRKRGGVFIIMMVETTGDGSASSEASAKLLSVGANWDDSEASR